MDSRKVVFLETAAMLIGQLICTAVMFGAYALLDRFDLAVLFGGLAGVLLATLNFFLMAISASLAADKARAQAVKAGKALVQYSYMLRLAVLFVLLFVCAQSGFFNLFTLVLPLVFVRPIITVAEFFRKSGEKQV